MKIAIDAMGGDFAPKAIVEGAILSISSLPEDAKLVLVGREGIIRELMSAAPNGWQQVVEIVNADEVIEMGEHPTKALSSKPNSSISIGFQLLREAKVDIFCSAGNTGAMTVGALFSVKTIPGITRPAIAGLVPQLSGNYSVLLDIGANADCKPEMLDQFAQMGSIYFEHTFEVKKPRVALMNIGEEEGKGSILAQAAFSLLKKNSNINFIGNIEGKDLFNDRADVVVTDGFTGNVIFKLGESIYNISTNRGFKDEFVDKTNYEAVGGSSILGVNGNVMIAHGVSSPIAIKNMIGWAYKQASANVYTHIQRSLSS